MALTTAEKQQRYRERHLGVKGGKQRIQFFVSVQAKAQLERLVPRAPQQASAAKAHRLSRRRPAARGQSQSVVPTQS
jgi:hypothetical protein